MTNFLRSVLRLTARWSYPWRVTIGRRHRALKPVPRAPELAQFQGKWVALLDGRVITVGDRSTEIARYLGEHNIKGAKALYVIPPSRAYKVGVG